MLKLYQTMRYKLLLLDLDGTLTLNLGMPPKKYQPSPRALQAFLNAQKQIAIALCTGRDKVTVLDVVNTLHFTSPQVIEGGAKIIDAQGKELWVKYLSKKSTLLIFDLLQSTKTNYSIVVNGIEIMNTLPNKDLNKITAVLWYDLSSSDSQKVKEKLSQYSDLAINFNKDRTGQTIYITHREGTKSHGVSKLQEMMGISLAETIGVGDGSNDTQLLSSCGLKIAMGNAVPELKAIADYIAPSVDDDGVTYILEKFFPLR